LSAGIFRAVDERCDLGWFLVKQVRDRRRHNQTNR